MFLHNLGVEELYLLKKVSSFSSWVMGLHDSNGLAIPQATDPTDYRVE